MVPEANKQRQRSTVATLWTRLAFICRCSSKLRAMRRTNWQSKLMCNWAVVHFTGPVVSSAGGDHTQAPLSHHNGWFFDMPSLELIISPPCKCGNLWLLGATAFLFFLKAFHDMCTMKGKKKHTFASDFVVVNKGSRSPFSAKPSPRISLALPLNKKIEKNNSNIYSVLHMHCSGLTSVAHEITSVL